MRNLPRSSLALAGLVVSVCAVSAQKPPEKDFSNSPIVTRMMAFNKKKDGKLTKDEDIRLGKILTEEQMKQLKAGPGGFGPPGGRPGQGGPGRPGLGGPDRQ